jgi:hypothetical protein
VCDVLRYSDITPVYRKPPNTTVLDILQRARGEKLDHFDHLRILLSKKLEPRASRDLNQIWMNTNWIPKRNGGCITILK